MDNYRSEIPILIQPLDANEVDSLKKKLAEREVQVSEVEIQQATSYMINHVDPRDLWAFTSEQWREHRSDKLNTGNIRDEIQGQVNPKLEKYDVTELMNIIAEQLADNERKLLMTITKLKDAKILGASPGIANPQGSPGATGTSVVYPVGTTATPPSTPSQPQGGQQPMAPTPQPIPSQPTPGPQPSGQVGIACKKCGHSDVTFRYCGACYAKPSTEHEHRVCEICGYEWLEMCADKGSQRIMG